MEPSTKPARHLRVLEADQTEPQSANALAALVEQAQNGDSNAWATLYQRSFAGLYRHIGYLTQDPIVAEDLAQETFARALCALAGFDGRSSFETWLHGIGVNVVRNFWRGTGRRQKAHNRLARHLAAGGSSRQGDPELSHARKQRAAALLTVLQDLPPKLREAYVLLDLRQLPRAEAAAQLGITPTNLSARASRARSRVRDELAELGWITSGGGCAGE